MNLSQFKLLKQYSFYDGSIYNQIFRERKPPVVKRNPTVPELAETAFTR